MTPRMMIGCGAAILGFCLYSHARLMASRAQAAATAVAPHSPAAADLETPLMTKASVAKAVQQQQYGEKAPLLGPGATAGGKGAELPMSRAGSSGSLIKAVRMGKA